MDSDNPPGSGPGSLSGSVPDFAFAFNDSNFSDRVLRIEIVPHTPEHKPDTDGDVTGACTTVADWTPNRKRRREDVLRETYVVMDHEDQILPCSEQATEGGGTVDNQDKEFVVSVEELPSSAETRTDQLGDEATQGNDSSCDKDCSTVIHIKSIHISSPILAAKSPFFYKLFSNGMRESEQRHVTLRIQASEEGALMELLNFMYSNTLSTTAPSALVDVLKAAYKFEVASCMSYCSELLLNLPMTCESALLYLELPPSVLIADAVRPLTGAAMQFLAARFKDITKFEDEVLNLPLAGIEALLLSDDLQVASEDAVYDLVLKWARIHYPKLEERRKVLSTELGHLIRFPHMTPRKLRRIPKTNDFDPGYASQLVLDALFFKAEAPYRQRSLAAEAKISHRHFVERAYKYRPIKVVEFELPFPHCLVYLDLKKEECANLFPSGHVYSQGFHLGTVGFFLYAHCSVDQQGSCHCFGLFVGAQEKRSESLVVDYEFAARLNPTKEFENQYKGTYDFTGGNAVGYRNLFGISWHELMADDSMYFINGVLHLRAELTIKQ